MFVLDVSANAVQSGYLSIVADELESELMNLPGDRRTKIAFLCFDSALHFFKFNEDDEDGECRVCTCSYGEK